METSNNSGSASPWRQRVSNAHIRRRSPAAHQAFDDAFFGELSEINHGNYLDDRYGPDGHFDACSPAELLEATKKADLAYANSLLCSRGVRR